ncbi:MAG: hypothetical protein BWX54_01963 [Verrucomicrobia bacterium ADurb.Bin018]|nr:MAG: hypothetical protein BWX54_01963 [Verrucomicrobia bacterium ADurb.Bin018]
MPELYRLIPPDPNSPGDVAATADFAEMAESYLTRDLQAEADAKLGALLRKLPEGTSIERRNADGWAVLCWHELVGGATTPEGALKIAIGETK